MIQFGIFGPFDFEEKGIGGQSLKTRDFYYSLCDAVEGKNVYIVESTEYKKNILKFLFKLSKMMTRCKRVIILPAQKGIRILAPLLALSAKIFHTKLYYIVIGGWIYNIVKRDRVAQKSLKRFDCIFVETSTMKKELESLGFNNIVILENFKRLKPVKHVKPISTPIRLCYFSRVTKLKGIEDAISVINRINANGTKCVFDIYGPVVSDYQSRFNQLVKTFSLEINYKGVINPKESIDILQKYDLQLFPTKYRTEGIPGSILDSYFAGTPVVSSRWNSFSDIVIENETGKGFEQDKLDDFYSVLNSLLDDSDKIMEMKSKCIKRAAMYTSDHMIHKFLSFINCDNFYGDNSL